MFDSNWLEVAVILVLWVYWHRAKEDSALEGGGDIHEEVEAGAGLYGVDGRDYRGLVGGVRLEEVGTAYCCGLDSVVNRVYSLEISQTRQRQHRDGIVSVMNTEGKWNTARKRSELLDY